MLINLSIAKRIVLLVITLAVGLLSLAGLGALTLKSVNQVARDLVRHEFRLAVESAELRAAVEEMRRHERDILLHIETPDKVKNLLDNWDEALKTARQSVKTIAEIADPGEQRVLATEIGKAVDGYAEGTGQVYDAIASGDIRTPQRALEAFAPHLAAVDTMQNRLDGLARNIDAAVKAQEQQLLATLSGAAKYMAATVLVVLILGGLSSTWVARSITRPLATMARSATEIATRRDLTVTIPRFGRNELGEMAAALGSMIAATRSLIEEARRGAEQSARQAELMREVAAGVAASSTRQSEATTASAAAIEQLTAAINEVSSASAGVEEQSASTSSASASGAQEARHTAEEIGAIARGIAEASEVMASLKSRSQEIGGILGVIKDIADQTNLLALNAAIEAARAGESGRGFAVVADEVRKLAERTTEATVRISQMVTNIQTDTEAANANMQQAHARVGEGVAATLHLVDSLETIGQAAERVMKAIQGMSHALREQAKASAEIAHKVEQVAQTSEDNNQAAKLAESRSGELHQMSMQLRQAIGAFVV